MVGGRFQQQFRAILFFFAHDGKPPAVFPEWQGNLFMGALVGVRLQDFGHDSLLIGLVATAYFAGLALGSLRVGRVIDRVEPRGKHLLHRVEGDLTLHSHLRMEGSWRVYPVSRRRAFLCMELTATPP